MKTLCTQLHLVAILALSLPAYAKDTLSDLYGTWKIRAIIGAGAVSSLSDREARQIIGKTVLVEAQRFVFNGRPCAETSYEEIVEDTRGHFAREWNTEVRDIPLPDPVTVIDTGCNVLYPLRNGNLMVAEKGVFFEATRIKRARSR